MTETKQAKEKLYPVVITVDNHSHGGKPCKKGDTLQVTEATKAFMTEHKIIEGAG